MENFPLIHDRACYFTTHIACAFGDKAYLHLQHVDIVLLMRQEVL